MQDPSNWTVDSINVSEPYLKAAQAYVMQLCQNNFLQSAPSFSKQLVTPESWILTRFPFGQTYLCIAPNWF